MRSRAVAAFTYKVQRVEFGVILDPQLHALAAVFTDTACWSI